VTEDFSGERVMLEQDMQDLLALLDDSLTIKDGQAQVVEPQRLRATIHRLAEVSTLERGARQGLARYITRLAALAVGVTPASIYELYMARGRGEIPLTFTVPAINLRVLSLDGAKAVFRAARSMNAGGMIFEIARSEMGYTDQNPAEYATNILAAAITEDYQGPVFIQGDHFQASAKRYTSDPESELQALRDLMQEAIAAGFFNIDVDTSTLVDLSKATIPEQQAVNTHLSALFTDYIRSLEPEGITVSVGGEIGEVGGRNSTVEELRAYMDGFNSELRKRNPQAAGMSKISIQTGTSHGGVVLPDGSIKEVKVDFDTMQRLSQVARQDYGLAGAVQHGASTLPEELFDKFVEAQACEIHLATNFMNIAYDLIPGELRQEMYAFLDEKRADNRKPGMTDEQFYYKNRKYAIGPFKADLWNLSSEEKAVISQSWEKQFTNLFNRLGLADTYQYVKNTIHPVAIQPQLHEYVRQTGEVEAASDLSD
jgi:fructose/tagatose bisphosphate aldolase